MTGIVVSKKSGSIKIQTRQLSPTPYHVLSPISTSRLIVEGESRKARDEHSLGEKGGFDENADAEKICKNAAFYVIFFSTLGCIVKRAKKRVLNNCNLKEDNMPVVHTSHIRIEKHEGPHRTAHVENFSDPIHFGIHGGIKHFYQNKYGREIPGREYPATLDHIIAGVAG